jgi:hypothetical protein
MLCEHLKYSSTPELKALIRSVECVEFETPHIAVYLIECAACGGQIHSLEVTAAATDTLVAADIDELLIAQTLAEVRAVLTENHGVAAAPNVSRLPSSTAPLIDDDYSKAA